MSNFKIIAKEDVELISAVIRVRSFCELEFDRQITGMEFDMEAAGADVEKVIRTRVVASMNENGELYLTGDDLVWLLRVVERLFRLHRLGLFDELRKKDGEMERLCSFVRCNFRRLRKIRKDLRTHEESIDAAAGSAQKRVQPSSIIAPDDVSIVETCLRIEGYGRLLIDGSKFGMFAVNSDNETEFRYLIDDNLDDEGNLHLSRNNDIMAVLDATEVTREMLRGETFQADLQEIDRIADQLAGALDV